MGNRASLALAGIAAIGQLAVSGPAFAEPPEQMRESAGSMAGKSYEMAMIHGGQVSMTQHHHCELVFTDSQARVYVYDANQKPITDPNHVKVTMALTGKDGKMETRDLKYMGPHPGQGRTHGFFYLGIRPESRGK